MNYTVEAIYMGYTTSVINYKVVDNFGNCVYAGSRQECEYVCAKFNKIAIYN